MDHRPAASGMGVTCGRCGRPVEVGQVTGGAGFFGFEGWAALGWVPNTAKRLRRRTIGEPLITRFFGPARAPGFRCPSCRVVWFDY
jgi:hypothetical protein